jgi:hypothetical protein
LCFQEAQQDSSAMSRVKVWAASRRPSGHGQVGGAGVGHLIDGHAVFDRDGGEDGVTGVGRDQAYAENLAGRSLSNDLDQAAGVAVDHGTRQVFEGQDPARAVQSLLGGLFFGEPD